MWESNFKHRNVSLLRRFATDIRESCLLYIPNKDGSVLCYLINGKALLAPVKSLYCVAILHSDLPVNGVKFGPGSFIHVQSFCN